MGREIANSRKLGGLSERDALIYLLILPQHDGEGIVEADDVSMLVACGRFALEHGWGAPEMASARAALFECGAWNKIDHASRELAEYDNWQSFQRLDRIGRGSDLAGISADGIVVEEMRHSSGTVVEQLRHSSGVSPLKGREGKGREAEEKRTTTRSASRAHRESGSEEKPDPRNRFALLTSEWSRLRGGYQHTKTESWARKAIIDGISDDDALRAVLAKADARMRSTDQFQPGSWNRPENQTLAHVAKNLASLLNEKPPAPVAASDDEAVESMKRRTRELIESVSQSLPQIKA